MNTVIVFSCKECGGLEFGKIDLPPETEKVMAPEEVPTEPQDLWECVACQHPHNYGDFFPVSVDKDDLLRRLTK